MSERPEDARELAARLGAAQKELREAADRLERATASRRRTGEFVAGSRRLVRVTLVLTPDAAEAAAGARDVAVNLRPPFPDGVAAAAAEMAAYAWEPAAEAEADAARELQRLTAQAGPAEATTAPGAGHGG